jgi:peptidyl-prolyl cis-trans isomerase C
MKETDSALTALRDLLARRASEVGLLALEATEADVEAAIERLLDREVSTPEPTDEECSRYYAMHPEEFSSGDLVFARHILFAVTPGAPLALIRTQAEKVLGELTGDPSRFTDLAARYSNCPSGAQGGNLGQLSRGECVPEFEQALFEGRAIGVLPRLINTRFGFHILAIDQRVPGQRVPYGAVRDQIATRLYAQVQEKALKQYVQILAGQAGVDLPGIASATRPIATLSSLRERVWG